MITRRMAQRCALILSPHRRHEAIVSYDARLQTSILYVCPGDPWHQRLAAWAGQKLRKVH